MTTTLPTESLLRRPALPARLGVAAGLAGQVARRLAHVAPTVLTIVILNFFLLRLAPGDGADVVAAEQGAATAETMAQLRHHMGLDTSLLHQFLSYLGRLAHLDLGFSYRYDTSVVDIIASRLPVTLVLMEIGRAHV